LSIHFGRKKTGQPISGLTGFVNILTSAARMVGQSTAVNFRHCSGCSVARHPWFHRRRFQFRQ
jgi:hypothetical protein